MLLSLRHDCNSLITHCQRDDFIEQHRWRHVEVEDKILQNSKNFVVIHSALLKLKGTKFQFAGFDTQNLREHRTRTRVRCSRNKVKTM